MRSRIVLFIAAAALLFAIVDVSRLTSTTGYPPYSSLRSSVDGTKLLFEGLAASGYQVSRNYLPLDQLHASNAVIVYAGVARAQLESDKNGLWNVVAPVAARNNRVIVQLRAPTKFDATGSGKSWDVSVDKAQRVIPGASWTELQRGLYERKQGSGTVVLITTQPGITNAGMLKSSGRQLAISALAANHKVIFDEAHLGIEEQGSIMGLARRYRLQGLFYGFLALCVLFIWRHSVSFPPPRTMPSSVVAGTSQRRIAELLERHLRKETLIATCAAEWNRMHGQGLPAVNVPDGGDALQQYLEMQNSLQRKKPAIA